MLILTAFDSLMKILSFGSLSISINTNNDDLTIIFISLHTKLYFNLFILIELG